MSLDVSNLQPSQVHVDLGFHDGLTVGHYVMQDETQESLVMAHRLALSFGMGSLGFLIGIFAAWSESPIAATALPLIFGLAGGAGGFFINKMDVTTDKNSQKIQLFGVLSGFVLNFLRTRNRRWPAVSTLIFVGYEPGEIRTRIRRQT